MCSAAGGGSITPRERQVALRAARGLESLPGVRVLRDGDFRNQTGVVSFVTEGRDCEAVGEALARRGIALRAGQNTQERLFRRTADAPCAEAVSLATGAWEQTFTGLAQDSCAAVCPVESKVYFGAAGADSLLAANR